MVSDFQIFQISYEYLDHLSLNNTIYKDHFFYVYFSPNPYNSQTNWNLNPMRTGLREISNLPKATHRYVAEGCGNTNLPGVTLFLCSDFQNKLLFFSLLQVDH